MSKILIATTELNRIGGMASHAQNTAMELQRRGWEVHCLATNVRGDYFDELSRHYTCHDLSSVRLSPKKVFMAADVANSVNPDIILMNNCALMHYALPLINANIKPIAVLHSDDERFYAIASLFGRRVFRWISPSPCVATRFEKFVGGHHNRISLIPHGVDQRNYVAHESKKSDSRFEILFVGFLGESKGADLLPPIFAQVERRIPNVFLSIVGEGPLRGSLEAEFAKLNLHKKIRIYGPTPPEKISDLMTSAHLLLHPTNLEGFGLVIIEAMMCGTVPVVSKLAGVTDQIVQDGETGLLVTPLDVEGFARAIITLHSDSNLYRSMSGKAQHAAVENFSLDRMMNQYEELFGKTDDRPERKKRTVPGWYLEAATQYLRKRVQ